ncbi:hypothetical protein [Nocardia paucivorans]|uniref:hypothetical protein n=1 Tax=Nocardia paucivorans TaxID=114259 RepID=UPI00030FFEF3|nr:hypothetical protein [Nocardia paucivorans]
MNTSVLVRQLDAALIAPAATSAERLLGYSVAVAGTAFAVITGVVADWHPLSLVVIGLVAFDLFGGATVNAMDSAKHWWHRPGRTAGHHLAFVAVHVQPFLVAWAVPDFGWGSAVIVYLVTLGAAVIVVATPLSLRRPVGFALTTLALSVILAVDSIHASVSWLAPVLLIKLLLAHIQPEQRPR